jgi:hypothetical protein
MGIFAASGGDFRQFGRLKTPNGNVETPGKSTKARHWWARYVAEEARSGNRASPAAFLPDPPDSTRKRPPYLSVNSLEIESLQEIANYHRKIWQNNSGNVALAAHKVFHYREAGRQSGITIEFDREARYYVFRERSGQMSRAFECIPRTDIFKSSSHSGVHFVRALEDHQVGKFARRMSGGKLHLL